MTATPASTRRLASALLRLWDRVNDYLDNPDRGDPVTVLQSVVEQAAEALADVVTVEPLTLYREED